MADFSVEQATATQADEVGQLVHRLLVELVPDRADTFDAGKLTATARALLSDDEHVWAFLARDPKSGPVGLLTLNRCAAIYAGGYFGEICELYVDPAHRSAGVGAELVDAAVSFARNKKWTGLEVGAPDLPRWQRTVDFYTEYGFHVIGPRLHLGLNA